MFILEFDVLIILISKVIYERGDSCFEIKLLRYFKILEIFYFLFKLLEKYFVFDLEEYL